MTLPPADNTPSKICTRCKTLKPLTEFHLGGKSKDKRQSRCILCRAELQHAHYVENIDAAREYARRYYAGHKEAIKENTRRYVAKDPQKKKEQARRYRATHPRHRDPEQHRKAMRDRYAAHTERIKAKVMEWRRANKAKVQEIGKRHRARKHDAAIADFTLQQWIELQELCDHRCHYCKKRFKGRLTQDHIIPLSKGGNHTLSNIIPACGPCNSRKHAGDVLCPVQPFLLIPTRRESGRGSKSSPA